MKEETSSKVLEDMCTKIYLIGFGNFWHTEPELPKWKRLLYKFYSVSLSLLLYGFILNECLEVVFNTFPTDQHRDCVSFAIAQLIVFVKLQLLNKNKDKIKKLIVDVIDVCKGHEDEVLLKKQRRLIMLAIVSQFFVIYSSILMYTLEAMRRYFNGEIFVAIVSYWPKYEDQSHLAVTIRILVIPIMMTMMATMIFTEMLAVCNVIIVSFKFVTIINYFNKIRDEFLINYANEEVDDVDLADKLRDDILKGLLMHRELLRIIRNVDKVFGLVISIQVCQSSGVAVSILIRLAFQENLTITTVFMSIFFMCALLIELALFMLSAGDITYNASLVPDAIFHCGWYMCPMSKQSHKDLRRIVLMGIIQSQKPVVLKAFGVKNLSYDSFVSVIRTTYSIFALFY